MWLSRIRPARMLTSLQEEFDRLFDGCGSELLSSSAFLPQLDLSQADDHYLLKVDLPGVKREEVDLACEDGVLTLSGERKQQEKSEGEDYVRMERRYGKFSRTLRLPEGVDFSKISAELRDGVLVVTLPKSEEAKPRKIEVEVR